LPSSSGGEGGFEIPEEAAGFFFFDGTFFAADRFFFGGGFSFGGFEVLDMDFFGGTLVVVRSTLLSLSLLLEGNRFLREALLWGCLLVASI